MLICKPAQRAVKFYAGRIAYWRSKMGRDLSYPGRAGSRPCPRYLAHILQRKAYALRKAYPKWRKRVWEHEYAWWKWLPDKWQRIARCETGYQGGTGPGGSRWDWNSGPYQGAFGFAVLTWDQFKPAGAPSEAYWATPREQYECALNVYYRFGYGAWGCANA